MFYVYMVASRRNGTLYTGYTDDLLRRIEEHRSGAIPGFSKTYGCTKLVWFELHDSRGSAYSRECQIKKWNRAWKIRRIEILNPHWDDLFPGMTEEKECDARRIYDPAIL